MTPFLPSGQSLAELADILEKTPRSGSPQPWQAFLNRVENEHFPNIGKRIETHISHVWQELEDFTISHSC